MTKEDLIDILVPKNQNTERKFFNKVKNSVSALYDMIAGTVTPLADDIIEDSTHRFVTDVQIADWDLKEDSANKGTASGYAELDETGRVPVAQLPAFVDEVIEAANAAALPATGAASAIYVTLDDNKVFRWGGTAYVEISATIALGELSTTAYRGDRGKIAYDHSQVTHDKALVGLGNVDNTSDMDKPVSTAQAAAIALVGGPGISEIDDLSDAKTGGASVFLGADAGLNDNGSTNGNTALGEGALKMNVSGTYNTAIGAEAMRLGANGHGNTAIGGMSLFACTSSSNTAIGSNSLQGITTGGENTAVGVSAGQYIEGSGTNQTSSNSVYVGRSCKPSADGNINEIIIGHSAIGKGSDTAVIGDDNVTDFYAGQNGQATAHIGKIQLAALNTAPTSATDTGTVGEVRFDDTYMYVCVATDTWKRSLMETW